MTRRPDPNARVRLFVALDIPADAREALAAWSQEVLGDDDSLRLVGADALHVTLAFLGWCGMDEVDHVIETVPTAVAGLAAPLLTPRALVGLPRRSSRVLALDLDDADGRGAAIQAATAGALVAAAVYEAERRPFRPHITVARVRRGGVAPTGRFPDPPPAALSAREVAVYRSDLSPAGARYTALKRVALSGGGT